MTKSSTTPGAAIRQFRKAQNPKMSLKILAERLGTTEATLSRIENGIQPVTEDLLPKFIQHTRIPAAVLRPDLAKFFLSSRERRPVKASAA